MSDVMQDRKHFAKFSFSYFEKRDFSPTKAGWVQLPDAPH